MKRMAPVGWSRFDLSELARIRHNHQQRKVGVGVGQGGGHKVRPLHRILRLRGRLGRSQREWCIEALVWRQSSVAMAVAMRHPVAASGIKGNG